MKLQPFASALLVVISCGQSAPTGAPVPGQPYAAPAAYPAPGAIPPGPAAQPVAPQNPLAALAQIAQGLQGMQAPTAGQVVNWRQLGEALPAGVPGWTASGEIAGGTGAAMGFAGSEARREFAQGDRRLNFEVSDSSINAMAATVFNMARSMTIDSSTELQRPVDLAGQPGYLKHRHDSRSSEAVFMVGNRFILTVRCSAAASPDEVLQLAGLVNVARLLELARASVVPTAPPPAP